MDNTSCSDLSNLSHELITEENWLLEGQYRVNGLVIAVVLVCFVLIGVPFNIYIQMRARGGHKGKKTYISIMRVEVNIHTGIRVRMLQLWGKAIQSPVQLYLLPDISVTQFLLLGGHFLG